MRTILLAFVVFLCEQCNEDSSGNSNLSKEDTIQNQVAAKNKSKDSLILQEILGFNDESTSALIIQKDTVFILIPYHWDKSKYESLRNFYYDPKNSSFSFNFNGRADNNGGFIKLDSFLKKPQVYLRSLLKPEISYPKLTDKLKDDPKIKNLFWEKQKVQVFNDSYYFINTESPKVIRVYNTVNNELKTYVLSEIIMDVTDLFLFDLDKDESPEIFVLHKGLIPRDEIISYSIYSLRMDSAKANYK